MHRVLSSWWIVFLLSLAAMLTIPMFGATGCSPISKALADLGALETGLELFHSRNHRYPSTEEGINALAPGFFLRVSRDPWGNEYVYRADQGSFVLYSIGVDARDDGGDGDDVKSSKKGFEYSKCRVDCGIDLMEAKAFVLPVLLLASALVGLARGILHVYRFFSIRE
jgi:general secretion pathway protein G